MKKIYPNDQCPCGSGKKYKNCCGAASAADSFINDDYFDMPQYHKEGDFSIEEVKEMLDDNRIIKQIHAEYIMLRVLEQERGDSVFGDAYTAFKNRIIEEILSNTLKIHEHKKRIEYLQCLLPYVRNDSRKTHRQFHDISYSSIDTYSMYSSTMDLAETYAMFLLYIYAETSITKITSEESLSIPDNDRLNDVTDTVKRILLDTLPFVGPRLIQFRTFSKNNKYLDDDIKGVRGEDVRARFFLACGKRDIRMAYKLLGELRMISPEEIDYYEGYVDYSDEQYEDALHYLRKVKTSSKKFLMTKALILECYAMLGDVKNFMESIEGDCPLSYDFVRYAAQLLIKNSEIGDVNVYQIVSQQKYSGLEDLGYRELVRRNSFDAMIEGEKILREYTTIKKIYDINELRPQEKNLLKKYNQIIRFYLRGSDFFSVDNTPAFSEGAMGESLAMGIMALIRDKYIGHGKFPPTSPRVTLDDRLFAFEALYRLGLYEGFYHQVSYALEWFKSVSYKPKAVALLKKAYVEGLFVKNNDSALQEYIKTTFYKKDTSFENDILSIKMRKALSSSCYVAYEAAEWQYRRSLEEDYGWKDAGMISLAYFRIVERMINEEIIARTAQKIGASAKERFKKIKAELSDSEKKKLVSKWSDILSAMQKVLRGKDPGLMLGSLEHYFKIIGTDYNEKDELACLFRNTTKEILTKEGFEILIDDHYLEECLNSEKRSKFRNPPAHCKYLPYGTAKECREYTCDLLYLIHTCLTKDN